MSATNVKKELLKLQETTEASLAENKTVITLAFEDINKTLDETLSKAIELFNGLVVEVERLKSEKKTLKEIVDGYKKKEDLYMNQEEALKKREERTEKLESIIEEEKKLLVNKKRHLTRWESELRERDRRLKRI